MAINNAAGANAVNVQDGGNSITVDAPVTTPVFVRLSDGSSAIATLPVSLASVPSHAVTNAGVFVVQENGAALTSLQLLDNAISGNGYNITQFAGVNNVTGSGNATGALRVELPTNGTGVIATVSNLTAGTVVVFGDVPHDSPDIGNPVKLGGKAYSAEPSAVTANDRVNGFFDLTGRQIVSLSNPENMVSGVISTAMTGLTLNTLLVAAGSGLRNYITHITVSNSHATVGTDVAIIDGVGGSTMWIIPAAAVYGGGAVPLPTPLRQPSTNTVVSAVNMVTGAATRVSANGYKGI